MACDCISKSEAKTREYIQAKHPDWEIITGSYNNKTFIYEGPQQGIVITNEFETLYTTTKADGTKTKSKKNIVQMFGQYCPFCGSKMVENKEGEDHPDTIFDIVKKCNATEGLKSIEAKVFVMPHSNGSPNTFTIWTSVKGLKRPVSVGIERHVVVAILQTLTRLYTESPTVLDITKYDWRNYDGM